MSAWVGWARAEEAAHLAWVIADLKSSPTSTTFTAAARGYLLRRYRKRLGGFAAESRRPIFGPSHIAAHLAWIIADLESSRTTTTFTAAARSDLLKRYRAMRLRHLAETYISIVGLTVPLALVAAYELLHLHERGMGLSLALLIGGGACAVLYDTLGRRLRSIVFASLSLVAMPVAIVGLAFYTGRADWLGLAMVGVAAGYALLATQPSASGDDPWAVFVAPSKVMLHAVAALGLLITVAVTVGHRLQGLPASNDLLDPALPATVIAIIALYTWVGRLAKWQAFYVVTAAGLSMSVLAISYSLRHGAQAAMVELVFLAWAYALLAPRLRAAGLTGFLRAGAAVQALAAALVPLGSAAGETALLLFAGGVGVFLVFTGDEPRWLFVAGALVADAWFWGTNALLPPPTVTAATIATRVIALPIVYGLGGVLIGWVRVGASRKMWSAPLYILAAIIAFAALVGLSFGNHVVLGGVLVAYAAVIYFIGVFEHQPLAASIAIGCLALDAVNLLNTGHVQLELSLLALVALGFAVYGSATLWQGRAEPEARGWIRMHERSALWILALNALVCFGFPSFTAAGSTGAATGLIADLALAGLLLDYGRTEEIRGADYVAALVASLGGIWISYFFGLTNVEFLVLGPGACLLGIGLHMRSRSDIGRTWSNLCLGAGAALLIGTSGWQASATPGKATYIYTAVLVLEGVAAIGAGIYLKSRLLMIAGGAAVSLAALRALFQVIQVVPLAFVFGAVALLALAIAAVLALGRRQLRYAGTAMGSLWRRWG